MVGLSRTATLLIFVISLVGSGCSPAGDSEALDESDREASPMAGASAIQGGPAADTRTFSTPDEFADGYWVRPVPPQGPVPEGFTPLDSSLRPVDCGVCHPDQYADWQTTLHSDAYSPGLAGQAVNWEQGAYGTVSSCLVCHAPLSEQSAMLPAGGAWAPNPAYDPELRDAGVACAVCHVRGWRRYGPPRLDGSTAASPEGAAHGGVTRTDFFEDSRFCSGCHQFGPGGAAPNGKPLENTFVEWQASRYADEGVSCQACHMPGRRHVWRGVHDQEMVRSGVTIEWLPEGPEAGLRITNTGTGHRFPTYATPEVIVRVELLDASGELLEHGVREHVIARRIAYQGGWVELSDTRLAPDSSVVVSVPVIPDARQARATVAVNPDAFYRGVFDELLSGFISDTSRALLEEADRRAQASPFTIFDERVELDQ